MVIDKRIKDVVKSVFIDVYVVELDQSEMKTYYRGTTSKRVVYKYYFIKNTEPKLGVFFIIIAGARRAPAIVF